MSGDDVEAHRDAASGADLIVMGAQGHAKGMLVWR
jgi:hypothetical protein